MNIQKQDYKNTWSVLCKKIFPKLQLPRPISLVAARESLRSYSSRNYYACTLSDTGGRTRSEKSQKSLRVCWCGRYVDCFWIFDMQICWITGKVGLILKRIWFLTWSVDQVCKIVLENVNKHGFKVSQVRTQHFQ